MKTLNLKVGPRQARTSLVSFLALNLQLSGKKAKALLDARSVFVNNRRVWMARHMLQPGDVLQVLVPDPVPAEPRVPILFRDDHYLVADKPPGILSNEGDSLEALLRRTLKQPGLCATHRLDRDTSGCLLMALHREACDRIIPLFRDGRIFKAYHAIVSGAFPRTRQTIRQSLDGREAVTHLMVLDSSRDFTHLLIKLETGRTHQIRKHLTALGHPLLGDRQYGTDSAVRPDIMKVPRQMLHATELRFPHPYSNATVRATAPLPPDFRQCLRATHLT